MVLYVSHLVVLCVSHLVVLCVSHLLVLCVSHLVVLCGSHLVVLYGSHPVVLYGSHLVVLYVPFKEAAVSLWLLQSLCSGPFLGPTDSLNVLVLTFQRARCGRQ